MRPGPITSPDAEVYRQLVKDADDLPAPGRGRAALRSGMLGLAAVGVLGWLWRGRDGDGSLGTAKTDTPDAAATK